LIWREVKVKFSYPFIVAYDKGNADDPIKYFAAPENDEVIFLDVCNADINVTYK